MKPKYLVIDSNRLDDIHLDGYDAVCDSYWQAKSIQKSCDEDESKVKTIIIKITFKRIK